MRGILEFIGVEVTTFIVFFRYKRKFREKELEASKLRKDLDDMKTAEIKALQVRKLL